MDGELVAIKKFRKFDQQVKERFLHELRIVQKLQHKNIAELLGFCFEYIENMVLEPNEEFKFAKNCGIGFVSRDMQTSEAWLKFSTKAQFQNLLRSQNFPAHHLSSSL
jgi:serine/threonine protein kinase